MNKNDGDAITPPFLKVSLIDKRLIGAAYVETWANRPEVDWIRELCDK